MKKTASHLQGQAKPSGPILLLAFSSTLSYLKEIAKDISRNKGLHQYDMLQI